MPTLEGTYGYRRIQAYLDRRGVRADGATVRSVMREPGLEAAQPRARARATVPAEDLDERPDLVGRDLTADEPGRKWCGDITCISTRAGFACPATVLDCRTRRVVGYATAEPCAHLAGVRGHRHGGQAPPGPGRVRVICHSDRGGQHTSQKLLGHLKTYGLRPPVGRTGVCWDNAWAESFNATLRNERVHRMMYPTKDKAVSGTASRIEPRPNHVRLHSALGYRTPNAVEQELLDLTKAAQDTKQAASDKHPATQDAHPVEHEHTHHAGTGAEVESLDAVDRPLPETTTTRQNTLHKTWSLTPRLKDGAKSGAAGQPDRLPA